MISQISKRKDPFSISFLKEFSIFFSYSPPKLRLTKIEEVFEKILGYNIADKLYCDNCIRHSSTYSEICSTKVFP